MKSSGLNTIVARSQKYSRMGSDEDPYERESPLQGSLFKEEESSSLQKLGESWTFKKQIDDGRSFSDFKIKIKGRMKERSNNGSAYNTQDGRIKEIIPTDIEMISASIPTSSHKTFIKVAAPFTEKIRKNKAGEFY